MSRKIGKVLISLFVLVAAACATARLTSSWKAPDTGPLNFAGKKVVALVISEDQAMRRQAEDSLARDLTARGVQGIPAHSLIPVADAGDREKAKARLQQAGVEGVVAMRVAGQNTEVNYVPGSPYSTAMWNHPYYTSFWGYYGWGWGVVSSPGYLKTDTVVTVETLIFSLPKDKLLWAAMSETTNPPDVDSTVRALAKEIAKRLKYEGLIR
jgi:hypothetical protein